MKKILLTGNILTLLAGALRAADAPILVVPEATPSFYRAGVEFDVSAGIATPDLDRERSSVGFGANLYVTENVGIRAFTSFEDLHGSTFDNVSVAALYRIPLGRHAIYGFAGGTRELNDGEWSIIGGPGFETRFTPRIGAFGELGFSKRLTGDREISATARVGLRVFF